MHSRVDAEFLSFAFYHNLELVDFFAAGPVHPIISADFLVQQLEFGVYIRLMSPLVERRGVERDFAMFPGGFIGCRYIGNLILSRGAGSLTAIELVSGRRAMSSYPTVWRPDGTVGGFEVLEGLEQHEWETDLERLALPEGIGQVLLELLLLPLPLPVHRALVEGLLGL